MANAALADKPAARRGAPKPARGPDWVRWSKPVVLLAGLIPVARLVYGVFGNPDLLGANPAETIEHTTGDWCLYFLLITLSVTPLRRLTGWNWLIKFRRMLGLFAFFYGFIHLMAYLGFDMVFDAEAIVKDIWKRPFVTVGFAALLLMTPLAITSTRGWVLRLGGPRWARLHQLIYVVATLGVLHYWWLVKRDLTWPIIFAAMLAILLGWRVYMKVRKRPSARRAAA
ncbi:protein-methionine-sulfoxide reductase heme-binding subunit MsrQ [Alsobacter metallidurans]|uniref:Protein-methionine-sulfoxide reductase heme-binding subunit MsrQ n=1 Tax=Alsobacter metallidurans TaxID=340221 RepID=A0A917I2E2_9HYPH|nr:protein-methionine-sulfoxide reductase heme-binding subunit MsrQ [Alsobacter metallidurans]GGH06808.1 protein-methionine-sulfoxide reductase heme-binding subunit MsrQ [Alsobacter metallidurans]